MDNHDLRTPRGAPARLATRSQTSDYSVLGATFEGVAGSPLVDEYGLADLHISGRFVDVGAHIGSVTVAVLLDNAHTTAVLVEPIPENVAVILANLAANGLADRATVIAGAVGTDVVYYGFEGNEHLMSNRYVANITGHIDGEKVVSTALPVRRVTLDELLPAAAMKLDCEGGEWSLFDDPRITQVPIVFGEWHGDPGADRIREVFGATHDVTTVPGEQGNGNFWAVAR